MSIPVSVLYRALKRVERSQKGGVSVETLAEYMDMLDPVPLVKELQDEGYIFLSTPAIRPNTKITIKNEGVKALLGYGLQVPEDERHSDHSHSTKKTRKRKRKGISWTWVVVALLLCVLSFFAGAYLAASTNVLSWFTSMLKL